MSQIISPGNALGVLGSGQLGRMFAIAARRLGYRVHVYSPDRDTPTGQVADVEITGAYDDVEALTRFSQDVKVVTFEFENVPLSTVQVVERQAPVRPAGFVLHTTQHRLREKEFLRNARIPVTAFQPIRTIEEAQQAPDHLLPGVLKTAAWGYDGKGQAKVASRDALIQAWSEMRQEAILEKLVDFQIELSVIGARAADGTIACYAPFENIHRLHILDLTISPARVTEPVARSAMDMARAILAKLDVVGVLCVEFFLTASGELLVNELAPRPHNSGHVTIDSHITCQFEQQVRAVCGLPLGSAEQFRPAAMANLLGDVWSAGEPDWHSACTIPELKLHLYGKLDAKPGRKMGHLSATGSSLDDAIARVTAGRDRLSRHVSERESSVASK